MLAKPGAGPLGWAVLWLVKEMDKIQHRHRTLAGHDGCFEDK